MLFLKANHSNEDVLLGPVSFSESAACVSPVLLNILTFAGVAGIEGAAGQKSKMTKTKLIFNICLMTSCTI